MPENKQQLMQDLKNEIAERCCDIETLARDYSLPISKVTVIARDPRNENMYVVVTNENDDGLKAACDLALKPPAAITT